MMPKKICIFGVVRTSVTINHAQESLIPEFPFHPPLTPLRENRLQVAFKQGAGVLEVLFGVGFGGGDTVKGFVEEGDDAVLFGKRCRIAYLQRR